MTLFAMEIQAKARVGLHLLLLLKVFSVIVVMTKDRMGSMTTMPFLWFDVLLSLSAILKRWSKSLRRFCTFQVLLPTLLWRGRGECSDFPNLIFCELLVPWSVCAFPEMEKCGFTWTFSRWVFVFLWT